MFVTKFLPVDFVVIQQCNVRIVGHEQTWKNMSNHLLCLYIQNSFWDSLNFISFEPNITSSNLNHLCSDVLATSNKMVFSSLKALKSQFHCINSGMYMKVLSIKYCSGLFLWNRVWDLGSFKCIQFFWLSWL